MSVYRLKFVATLRMEFTRNVELEIEAENEETVRSMMEEYEGRALRGSSELSDMIFERNGGLDLLNSECYEDGEVTGLDLDVESVEPVRDIEEAV